jgi:YggT family protein
MPSSSSSSTTTCAQQQAQHSQSAPVQLQQLHNTVSSGPQQQNKQSTPYLQASLLLGAAAVLSTAGAADAAQQLHLVADLDAASAHTLESILRPLFAAFTVLYIIRITMTWYPNIDGTKLPWLLAYGPTEPFLKFTRSVIPLVGGVDITPIVWVALISFFNEILLGPQGILMLIQRESGAGLL